MTNAELFKKIFGIYAEEFWAYPKEEMLDWITSDVPSTDAGDLISRQAAIEALHDWELMYTWDEHCKEEHDAPYIVSPSKVIDGLPPAQPEQKKGKWIRNNDSDHPVTELLQLVASAVEDKEYFEREK